MNQYFEFTFLCISTLFSLINPIGIAPIFLTLTERFSINQQRKIAKKGVLTGFLILVIFAYLGTYIFSLYSISIDAFRIMGGIIFFRSGLKMLESIVPRTRTTPAETEESLEHDDIAISPIGIPIVTGPGAITAAMILAGQTKSSVEQLILFFAILFVIIVTLIIFYTAPIIFKKIGSSGSRLIQRLMGIILMVIAVQFVIDGVTNVLSENLLNI
tara:strand:- start:5187 stop:5831 length:645 start_codon:yes stop_codon:yes gene_type:complete